MGTTTETNGALEVTLTQEQIDKFHARGLPAARGDHHRRRR